MPDWDAKYAAAETSLFGDEPNQYVREIAARSDFAPATVLCLADGDGRNSAWLARQGFAVTALDLSAVAVARARARDAANGVEVERLVADLAAWRLPPRRSWDAALLVYLQCERETRLRVMRTAAAALAPGGWFVLEAFAERRGRGGAMGPDDPALCYSLEEVAAALPGFQPIEALTGCVLLEEGVRHRGLAEVVRFAGRKPT